MKHRIGLIVPSSNITVETELPAVLARSPDPAFSFHGSRARMREVTSGELAAMNRDVERCAVELSDADIDIIVYGCLVALISQGHDYHEIARQRIAEAAAANGRSVPVITSAGALVSGLHALEAERVAIVTPYMKPLTAKLIEFLAAHSIEVVDSISLCVSDNIEVGRLDPAKLPEIADQLDVVRAQAVVLSACVQMPSLPAIASVEARLGLPTLSATTATAREILRALERQSVADGVGRLLSEELLLRP
jgi:maleate isomerase